MAVELVRLLDSDFYALSTGDEFKAAFTLWSKAFMQLPAGSLPADDRILAHLSGAGANWPNVKEMALHGWFKCSDGRLYHHTVSEKVMDAWRCRCAAFERTSKARAARAKEREKHNQISVTEVVTESVTDTKRREENGREERTPPTEVTRPAAASPHDRSPRDQVWERGPQFVRAVAGVPDKQARGIIGKMVSAAGDDCARVLDVLQAAQDDRPAGDVVAFLIGACRHRAVSKHEQIRLDGDLPTLLVKIQPDPEYSHLRLVAP